MTVTQQANGTSNAATASPTPGSANRWQLPEDTQLGSASDFYNRVDNMYDVLIIYTFLQVRIARSRPHTLCCLLRE